MCKWCVYACSILHKVRKSALSLANFEWLRKEWDHTAVRRKEAMTRSTSWKPPWNRKSLMCEDTPPALRRQIGQQCWRLWLISISALFWNYSRVFFSRHDNNEHLYAYVVTANVSWILFWVESNVMQHAILSFSPFNLIKLDSKHLAVVNLTWKVSLW